MTETEGGGGDDGSATRSAPVPAAQGVRAPWTAIPPHLRARVAEIVGGGEVVAAVTQSGGFSPGPAVRVRTSTGHRAFVKAVSAEMNPDTPDMHRGEARYTAQMPAHAPVPKLLGALDEDGWVILVFEEIDGRNPDPDWDPGELRRAVAALAELADVLTPSPVEAPPAAERLRKNFRGWSRLQAARAEGTDDLAWLDPWARERLDTLVGLQDDSAGLCEGTTLVNMDVRADNILMTADRVYIVDWPWAAVGAAWLDLGFLAPSVWMHSGPDRARIVTEHPLLADADPEAVTAFVARLAGMLLERSRQPAPQGLPTVRGFQRAYGTATLEWLRTRMT
ncbi:MAG: phosphotransferase [Catenulispora sp.]|nr:phosphotransferase [Catenulispora sp.]